MGRSGVRFALLVRLKLVMSTMAYMAFQAGDAGSIPVARSTLGPRDRHPDFWPVRRSIQLVSIAA
jgi:hypothetical protein